MLDKKANGPNPFIREKNIKKEFDAVNESAGGDLSERKPGRRTPNRTPTLYML